MNPETSGTDRLVDRLARSTTFDQLADAVQPTLRKALEGTGRRGALKNILHGKQLGHSLHAAVTDVPVGAWTLAAVFDSLELAGRKRVRPSSGFCHWLRYAWRRRGDRNGSRRMVRHDRRTEAFRCGSRSIKFDRLQHVRRCP